MSLAQGNNTPIRPRIEAGSPDLESDALTTRPVRPPSFANVTQCLIGPRQEFVTVYSGIYCWKAASIVTWLVTGQHSGFKSLTKLTFEPHVRKPVFGFPTRSHTNQAVQPHKMARGLKFQT